MGSVGVRAAIDVGKARIGIAVNTAGSFLAFPYETVNARVEPVSSTFEVLQTLNPEVAYIGYPIALSGKETASTVMAKEFAMELHALILTAQSPIHLRFLDERGTTTLALQQFQELGKKTKKTRHIVDQQAAVNILQMALDFEKASGTLAGKIVEVDDE